MKKQYARLSGRPTQVRIGQLAGQTNRRSLWPSREDLMPSRFWHWLRSLTSQFQHGQGLAEYGLLLVLVAVTCVAILAVVGQSIDGLYSQFAAVFPR